MRGFLTRVWFGLACFGSYKEWLKGKSCFCVYEDLRCRREGRRLLRQSMCYFCLCISRLGLLACLGSFRGGDGGVGLCEKRRGSWVWLALINWW
jgi:hypothetical protein